MNIYLIRRTDDVGYDEFDAVVMTGNSAEEAERASIFAGYKGLETTLVGTGDYDAPTLILGSFNAG